MNVCQYSSLYLCFAAIYALLLFCLHWIHMCILVVAVLQSPVIRSNFNDCITEWLHVSICGGICLDSLILTYSVSINDLHLCSSRHSKGGNNSDHTQCRCMFIFLVFYVTFICKTGVYMCNIVHVCCNYCVLSWKVQQMFLSSKWFHHQNYNCHLYLLLISI